MFFLRSTVIATLCCFGTSVLASSWPSSIQGQPLPDKWFQINLDQLETTLSETEFNSSLVERTPVNSCLAVLGGVSSCITIGSFIIQMCQTLAGGIKAPVGSAQLQHHEWHYRGRQIYLSLHWPTLWYDSSERHHCRCYQKVPFECEHNKICGTLCLRLDHGGTWNGWLKLGPVGSFNEKAYCGVGLPFNSCVSGNNDI